MRLLFLIEYSHTPSRALTRGLTDLYTTPNAIIIYDRIFGCISSSPTGLLPGMVVPL